MIELNKIYNENCLDTMARMENNFIDLTVTSPPYDNLRTYNGYEFDFERIAKELYRVTKQGGVVVWVVGDATIEGSETLTSLKQAVYFKENCGFNVETMIWEKTGQGAVGSNKLYWQNFEYMFILSKGDMKSINLIEDRVNIITGEQSTSGGRRQDGNSTSSRKIVAKEYGRRFNIWKISPESNEIHKAVYPEQLAKDHIISWSNENDIVYDPFMGSGTTAKMAINLKRNFIGSEISEEYCKLANERIDMDLNQIRF